MRSVGILCALCACASESGGTERGTISVTVLADGVPVSGVGVWFQAADGTLLLETRTDANGVAGSFAEDGASVAPTDGITMRYPKLPPVLAEYEPGPDTPRTSRAC